MIPIVDLVILALMIVVLVAIAIVDLRTMTIPDGLNGALFFIAVIAAVRADSVIVSLLSACLAAGVFYAVRDVHQRVAGRVGLGLGDVKFAFAAGAWLQPSWLPVFFFIASFSALVPALVVAVRAGELRTARQPFGPFLAFGLLMTRIADMGGLSPPGGWS